MKLAIRILPVLLLLTVFIGDALAQKKGEPVIAIPDFVIEESTQKVVYKEVVDEAGSKGVLFDKALGWATKYYKNPSNVLREKDKEKGRLVAKARFYTFYTDPKKKTKTRMGTIEYTLSINFKEGRYRYEITNINVKAQSYQGIESWIEQNKRAYNYATASYLEQVDTELNKVINDLKSAMGRSEKPTEDW